MSDNNDYFIFRKKNFIVVSIVIVLLGFFVSLAIVSFIPGKNVVKFNGDNVDENKITKLQTVLDKIEDDYYKNYNVNDLIEGAINGIVTSLNDKYTVYYKPGSMAAYKQYITGNFNGIGITSLISDYGLLISGVTENTPASIAGLVVGDTITHIDGVFIIDMTSEEITAKTSNFGVSFNVTISHADETIEEFTLIPEQLNKDSVIFKEYENKIFYLRITQFDNNTGTEFENAINTITNNGCQGLIIDIRNNGGGYAREAAKVADVILPKGDIAYEKNKKGEITYTFTSNEGEISYPIVMLINENTASASELLAGAFKDYNKGTIIGVNSYGKSLAQTSLSFENDSSGLVITIAEYYTPSGISINGVGIMPNIVVESATEYKGKSPENIPFDEDLQLIRAFQELKEQVN